MRWLAALLMMERMRARLISSPASMEMFEKETPSLMNSGTMMALRISMCWPLELTSQPWTTQLDESMLSVGHVPTPNWVSLLCSDVYMDCSMLLFDISSSDIPSISVRLMLFLSGNSFSILDSGLEVLRSSRASSTVLRRWVRTAIVLARDALSMARSFFYLLVKCIYLVYMLPRNLRTDDRFSMRTMFFEHPPRGLGVRRCAEEGCGADRRSTTPSFRRPRRR